MTFMGGLGSQIISAAGYFWLQKAGEDVLADFSYFSQGDAHWATAGTGEINYYAWELGRYGLQLSDFNVVTAQVRRVVTIDDGPKKLRLGLKGLTDPEIAIHFPAEDIADVTLLGRLTNGCVLHLRRGDYLNVASHLVPDELSVRHAVQFAAIVPHAVVVSDSDIPQPTLEQLEASFSTVTAIVRNEVGECHAMMRQARILVGSNSQLSLTAAALRTQGLSFLPTTWLGAEGDKFKGEVDAVCSFQWMNA